MISHRAFESRKVLIKSATMSTVKGNQAAIPTLSRSGQIRMWIDDYLEDQLEL